MTLVLVGRTPQVALLTFCRARLYWGSGIRASRADQGVRPTKDQGVRATKDQGVRATKDRPTKDQGVRLTKDE
jgi:hypothetical protein